MSSAAQLGETPESYGATVTVGVGAQGGGALKQLAAERVAAHRNRRAVVEVREAQARREQAEAQAVIRAQARREAARVDGQTDASRVREAVAARYQQSVSYREFLAEESQRALDKARAEAEVAARNAKALAEAQRELLEEMEQWPAPELEAHGGELLQELPLLEIVEREMVETPAESSCVESSRARKGLREEAGFEFTDFLSGSPAVKFAAPSSGQFSAAELRVRLHEEVERARPVDAVYAPSSRAPIAFDEMAELDEEIEFRCAPEFEDLVMETQAIPANIIQFPRELVASRKARPRLAEGPLRADGTPEPQLRIFEVEMEQISAEPEVVAPAEAPEWQGMMLGGGAAAETKASMSPQLEAQLQLDQQLFAAPVQRRMLSAAMDAFCVVAGFAGFAAVAEKIAGPLLRAELAATSRPLLGGAVVGVLVMFAVIYKLLFFTLNDATPGMRVARIAFCTFNEKNPTRRALRRRLVSTALAACPLGLGLVWMMLDGDRLGWHDRMSRMYPREY
jgi:hypothetical protein